MVFYQLETKITFEKEETGEGSFSYGRNRQKDELLEKSNDLTDFLLTKSKDTMLIYYVKEVFQKHLFAIAIEEKEKLDDYLELFFEKLALNVKQLHLQEISLKDFSVLLRRGSNFSRYGLKGEWISRLYLEELIESKGPLPLLEDQLIEKNLSKKDALRLSKKVLFSPSLTEEVKRIFAGKIDSNEFSHPVHYIIESNLEEVQEKMADVLLGALKKNHRLKTTRYLTVPIEKLFSMLGFKRDLLEAAYRTSKGERSF